MNEHRARTALIVLRFLVAALIAAHGWARLWAEAVTPFGDWLSGQGVPFGPAIAWSITVLEIVGTPLLAFGLMVRPLSLAFAVIFATGLVIVHFPEGWFVVGLGRNGMEYSVLLVTCLLGLAWANAPRR